MVEIVSGWNEGDEVFVAARVPGGVEVRRLPARWSFFVEGMDDDDRRAVQRTGEVRSLEVQERYTRVDCSSKWSRRRLADMIAQASSRDRVREADVGPLRRFLTDHATTVQVAPDPKVAWFDLETDSRRTFADARDGKARVLSWAVNVDGESWADVLEADTDEAERALLVEFFELLRESGADVCLAWNGLGFDFPVLRGRLHRLGVEVPWYRWCWLDHLEVFQKYHAHGHASGEEHASYRLEDVARAIAGEGKHGFDASQTWEAWSAGGAERERLLRYNVQDTELLPKIEAATGYVEMHLTVCHLCRCVPDSGSLRATEQGDGFLLPLGAEHGFRWPTKWDVGEVAQYEGAWVMEPTRTGVVEDVHVADFAGLYPAIMRSWNMSLETVHKVSSRDEDPSLYSTAPHRQATRFLREPRGLFPRMLDVLVAMRAEYQRKMADAVPGSPEWHHYKRLSQGAKIIANSAYGITGSPFSRFFDPAVASAVTTTGKWLLEQVVAASRAAELDPFYGDTDSVFVHGDADRFAAVVDDLNGRWPAMLEKWGAPECHIRLEFEKSFRRMVLVTKKRYAASLARYKGADATADAREIKGLEYMRGDQVRLAREMQREAIDLVLDPDEVPPEEQARELVARWRERVLHGELVLEDVLVQQSLTRGADGYDDAYTTTDCSAKIGKGKAAKRCGYDFGGKAIEVVDEVSGERVKQPVACPVCGTERKVRAQPPHVRVGRLLAERGEEAGEGTRIRYVYVESEGGAEPVPHDDPGALERIDRAHYWTKKVLPPTARFFAAAFPGGRWDETRRTLARAEPSPEPAGPPDLGPLFAGCNPGTTPPPRQEPLPTGPRQRVRRRPAPVRLVVGSRGSEEDGAARALLRAIRARAELHPGPSPLVLELGLPGAVAEVATGLSVEQGFAELPTVRALLAGRS